MDPKPPVDVLTTIKELPARLFLAVVSAGVIGGLTIAAGSVWLSARFGAARRR